MKYLDFQYITGVGKCKQDKHRFLGALKSIPQNGEGICFCSILFTSADLSNCSCLSLLVPGALISRLLILNTHFTSKATSNPQQVLGALEMIGTAEAGDTASLWKERFLIYYQLGPIITRDGNNKGAKRLFHNDCCSTGDREDKKELWWKNLNKRLKQSSQIKLLS